jgi:hypothetical protein
VQIHRAADGEERAAGKSIRNRRGHRQRFLNAEWMNIELWLMSRDCASGG